MFSKTKKTASLRGSWSILFNRFPYLRWESFRPGQEVIEERHVPVIIHHVLWHLFQKIF